MNLSIYPPALASVLHTTEQLWLPSMWQSECNTSEHYQSQRQATALYSFCFDTRPGPGQWPAAGGWSVGVGLAYDAQSLQAIQTTRLVLPAYGFLSQPPAGRPVTACRRKTSRSVRRQMLIKRLARRTRVPLGQAGAALILSGAMWRGQA